MDPMLVILFLVGTCLVVVYTLVEIVLKLLRREPFWRTIKRAVLRIVNWFFSFPA